MPWIDQLQSANWSEAGWIALGAYCLGCFTTGYYLVRQRTGLDLRELGSGSLGARNVGRVLGWPGFVLTLLGDFAKGWLAVWGTQHFTKDGYLVQVAMLAVVAGHVWPAQLRFHGGKGVSTSLGALLAYDFRLAVAFALVFAGPFLLFRRTVMSGLVAFACLPLVSLYLSQEPARAIGISVLAGLVLIAHRKNFIEGILAFAERRHVHPNANHHEL